MCWNLYSSSTEVFNLAAQTRATGVQNLSCSHPQWSYRQSAEHLHLKCMCCWTSLSMKIMFSSFLGSWHISGYYKYMKLTSWWKKSVTRPRNTWCFLIKTSYHLVYEESLLWLFPTSGTIHLSVRAFVLDKGRQGGVGCHIKASAE